MSTTVFSSPSQLPPDTLLADCAVSGGSLEDYLRRLMRLAGSGLCIRLADTSMVFELPELTGTPLRREEALALCGDRPLHISDGLCTAYSLAVTEGGLRVILTDTDRTLRRKYALVCSLGIPMVLIESPELRRLLSAAM